MRRSQQAFQLIWMLLAIICALVAIFATFLVSCSRGDGADQADASIPTMADSAAIPDDAVIIGSAVTPVPEETPIPTDTPMPAVTTLAETIDQGESYLSSFMFLGDSTTYGMGFYSALPFTQIWTPASGTMNLSNQSYTEVDYYNDDGTKDSLPIKDAVARRQPEYLVITLGLNGISYMSEDEFKEEYKDLISTVKEVSPNTKIICQSIFPVIDSQVSNDIGNDKISPANEWVHAIAEETGTRYLSTCDALKDDSGNLRSDYCNGDGIHLSLAGCQAVLQYIRTHGYV